MLSLILLILLIIGFFIGLRRGLILQLVHLLGFILAYLAAYAYYNQLASKLKLWIPYPAGMDHNQLFGSFGQMGVESVYYHAIAFIVIFIAVKIIVQIIGSMLDFLANLPILGSINRILGAIFGFIEIYLILFLLLYVGELTPVAGIKQAIDHSFVAQYMIQHTPVFSEKIKELWTSYVQTPTK